jgi:hypothetical protein
MCDMYFEQLEKALAARGVPSRYIDRLIAELEDHRADVATERPDTAQLTAPLGWIRSRLGDEAAIVAQVIARPELRGHWSVLRASLNALRTYSQNWVADCDTCAIAGPLLVRWSASIACGTAVTAALLLAMAQSIALYV